MKRRGHIYEKISDIENLRMAHQKARKDKGDYYEVRMVDAYPDKYLYPIKDILEKKAYRVSPYKVKVIKDGGKERVLEKLPYYPDRIIQWAIMIQTKEDFMRAFCRHTCASIDDRGIGYAAHLVKRYLNDVPGTQYCLKTDVHKFYPSLDREILKEKLRHLFKDPDLLWLLDMIIDSAPGTTGVPIGSYLSQYLANYYLCEFDHKLKEELRLLYVVRYMDDNVVLGADKAALRDVLNWETEYLTTQHLTLNQHRQIFPVDDRGVDFVGFRFFHGYTLLRKDTKLRMEGSMCACAESVEDGLTSSMLGSYASYDGWLRMCSSHRLREKYLTPVAGAVQEHYQIERMWAERRKEHEGCR